MRNLKFEQALRDLEERTLGVLHGELVKLLYLASTRDFATGRYYHDGLATTFTPDVAERVLQTAHVRSFTRLVQRQLADVVGEVERFVMDARADRDEVLRTWEELEPYRIAIPPGTEKLMAEFFVSNIRMAVKVLCVRQSPPLQSQRSA